MAWCPPGDEPLFELMVVNLLTYIYATRPQLVNTNDKTNKKSQLREWVYLRKFAADTAIVKPLI